ncbi:hypothetical protein [Listeria sp. PSOL-1]|uniref:hypothetical protein n=1 Tax=Listeria sp. PSOL-1 TaxID=1844999 RepID=UPI0013D824F6|nr:hypothetical protein [Listeria sp. PSOL-1]
MKKIIFLSIIALFVFLAVGCGKQGVPAVVVNGTISDASSAVQNKTLMVNGTLSWQGEAEKNSRDLTVLLNDSTKITDASGKTTKIASLRKGDRFSAVFPEGTKIVSPSPGKVSNPATSIKLTK